MLPNFTPDRVALECDPNLSAFGQHFDAGLHKTTFESEVGQKIYSLLISRIGVAMLIGAISSAPSRPPVVGIEPLLASQIGADAFADDMKRLTGRIIRYIVEYIGGRYEVRGVKLSKAINSNYASGTTYSFPDNIRR